MGKKRHSIDVLFMFVLFVIFAVLSVLIIYIGSGVYDRISENKEINEQVRTTMSYIANKVRETGGKDNVSIKQINGQDVLVLTSESDGFTHDTLVYEYNGKLMEMSVETGYEFDLKFGDELLDTDGVEFSIDEEQRILNISVADKKGKEKKLELFID